MQIYPLPHPTCSLSPQLPSLSLFYTQHHMVWLVSPAATLPSCDFPTISSLSISFRHASAPSSGTCLLVSSWAGAPHQSSALTDSHLCLQSTCCDSLGTCHKFPSVRAHLSSGAPGGPLRESALVATAPSVSPRPLPAQQRAGTSGKCSRLHRLGVQAVGVLWG